ncbi:deoxynucleotide monophosphate kinase [Ralstonia solanacearum]|nr:deoxynucleotide monophosphate kinase [Ralstonia solanacearum FJAT-1458]QKL71476.1 deoxynucleotide monophosphate kinase [Ralstonia solanacearum]QKL76685.1 deoxynucleotide monophosphate kinase [Ralstonia solanacearum]QKL81889.1 deoxynucleotide monophosphate kinase [Ralstonia solanacearum]QKL87100.1 deoxynucleotide monophosphate kinase [Ralstonia solanacearum]
MLIGLAGNAGVGKDTAAAHLRVAHSFRQIAFAAPIRAMLSAAFALERMDFEHGRKEEILPEIGKSPRQLMQLLGTEWGRHLVHPDIWVRLAEDTILAEHVALGRNVVVSDVREENEAAMIRRHGGTIVHLHRKASRHVAAHSSERGIELHAHDHVINNDGRPEELLDQLDELVLHLLTRCEAAS